jgi:hypothetical protein
MLIFQTTLEEKLRIPNIIIQMNKAGIDKELVNEASTLAFQDQGVFDLMELWLEERSEAERAELIKDIQFSIKEYKDYNKP